MPNEAFSACLCNINKETDTRRSLDQKIGTFPRVDCRVTWIRRTNEQSEKKRWVARGNEFFYDGVEVKSYHAYPPLLLCQYYFSHFIPGIFLCIRTLSLSLRSIVLHKSKEI